MKAYLTPIRLDSPSRGFLVDDVTSFVVAENKVKAHLIHVPYSPCEMQCGVLWRESPASARAEVDEGSGERGEEQEKEDDDEDEGEEHARV